MEQCRPIVSGVSQEEERQGFMYAISKGVTNPPVGVVSTDYWIGYQRGVEDLHKALPVDVQHTLWFVHTMLQPNMVRTVRLEIVTPPLTSYSRRALYMLTAHMKKANAKVLRMQTIGDKTVKKRSIKIQLWPSVHII